jgi:hypothetical protein
MVININIDIVPYSINQALKLSESELVVIYTTVLTKDESDG